MHLNTYSSIANLQYVPSLPSKPWTRNMTFYLYISCLLIPFIQPYFNFYYFAMFNYSISSLKQNIINDAGTTSEITWTLFIIFIKERDKFSILLMTMKKVSPLFFQNNNTSLLVTFFKTLCSFGICTLMLYNTVFHLW